MGPYPFFIVATAVRVAWILFLPWLGGLAVWESSWRTRRARLIAVLAIALGFIAFWWSGTPAGGTSP